MTKKKQVIQSSIFLFSISSVFLPRAARAVVPPDFIFSIGTQIAQFFSMIALFFSALFGAFFQFFQTRLITLKHKWIVIGVMIVAVLSFSLVASYFYAGYAQKNEYRKWLEESKEFRTSDVSESTPEENIDPIQPVYDENDQLGIGVTTTTTIDTSSETFVSTIDIRDSSAEFISRYYENIATGTYEVAYEMSKKSVDYATFKGWYLNTKKITLDKLVRIDERKSSLELTLFEEDAFTRYGVLMTLALNGTTPTNVEKSEVKILSQGLIHDTVVSLDDKKVSEEYRFFEQNRDANLVVSNTEFKSITESARNNYVVLDAREDIEYENGYFPASAHIRFADIKAGRWIELPKDKFMFVICWSGIRGKEVAEFLRTKKIVASYLEGGANGWVQFGGTWIGNIKFAERYSEERFRHVFTTDDVKKKITEGVKLVDTREPSVFAKWHIAGSVNIPIMYTPTIEMDKAFEQVPPHSKIITVCDGYVNCFDAKITGVELEKREHEFLGRYTKPWEYE